MFFVIYFLIGICSGFLAGLLGLGGGVIIVPALAATFAHLHTMPANNIMQMAIGTSLATVVITFLASLKEHLKRKAVRWDIVKLILPGVVVGAIVGSFAASALHSNYLQFFFALFLLFVAWRLFVGKLAPLTVEPPSRLMMMSFSTLVGMLSGILGVGGGLVLMPFLIRSGLNVREATGTSVACGVFIASVATFCYMVLGQTLPGLPWSSGFIYWPAFFGIAIASILFTPVGTIIAYKLSSTVLKRVLGIFLVVVAFLMLGSVADIKI